MFKLNDEQLDKLYTWQKDQSEKFAKSQYESVMSLPEEDRPSYWDLLDGKTPYYGAIGGCLTYCFTPTSLGVVVKVKDRATEEEIDLTNYDWW